MWVLFTEGESRGGREQGGRTGVRKYAWEREQARREAGDVRGGGPMGTSALTVKRGKKRPPCGGLASGSFREMAANIRQATDIVHADIVVAGQKDQAVHRNSGFAELVVTIGPLADLQQRGDPALAFITVLTQGTNTLTIVHVLTSCSIYHRGKNSIGL